MAMQKKPPLGSGELLARSPEEAQLALIISEGLRTRGFVGVHGLALALARDILATLPSLSAGVSHEGNGKRVATG